VLLLSYAYNRFSVRSRYSKHLTLFYLTSPVSATLFVLFGLDIRTSDIGMCLAVTLPCIAYQMSTLNCELLLNAGIQYFMQI